MCYSDYAKYFFPHTAAPANPTTTKRAATGIAAPVFGEAVTVSTLSLTTANGEKLAVLNVTEPAATLVGTIVSQAEPV